MCLSEDVEDVMMANRREEESFLLFFMIIVNSPDKHKITKPYCE